MSDDEDRGRNDLIQAILRVLAIDPEDDTTLVYMGDDGRLTCGDSRDLARRILDALDEAYTDRDLRHEWNYMGQMEREEPF